MAFCLKCYKQYFGSKYECESNSISSTIDSIFNKSDESNSILDALKGRDDPVTTFKIDEKCISCGGTGTVFNQAHIYYNRPDGPQPCPGCGGTGKKRI